MWLNETLKIKYPLIQGGMANIATGAFAAAVSNAGGLGLIAGRSMALRYCLTKMILPSGVIAKIQTAPL